MQNNDKSEDTKISAKLVYLSGCIFEPDDTPVRWQATAHKLLARKKIMTLAPTDADYGSQARQKNPSRFVNQHKNFLLTCDTILAKCEPFSYGTAMCIQLAWEWHKQIIVVTQCRSPWLLHYADAIFPCLDSALKSFKYPDFNPTAKKC